MHLADAFIQSDLQYIQAIHLYCQYVCSLGVEPTTFELLTQCSTTEPQEHYIKKKTVIAYGNSNEIKGHLSVLKERQFHYLFLKIYI